MSQFWICQEITFTKILNQIWKELSFLGGATSTSSSSDFRVLLLDFNGSCVELLTCWDHVLFFKVFVEWQWGDRQKTDVTRNQCCWLESNRRQFCPNQMKEWVKVLHECLTSDLWPPPVLLLLGDMDIQWWDHGAWHGEGAPMSMVRLSPAHLN